MPELPEVETISRQLDRAVHERKIIRVELLKSGRETPKGGLFVKAVQGQTVTGIGRRAKLVVWKFKSGGALLTHLKMTGRLILVDKNYQPQKHDRAVFYFTSKPGAKDRVVWSDIRQFGWMKVVDEKELKKILAEYGLEPLESTPQQIAEVLREPKTRKVKIALLDQTALAGVGNIYADEALFRAGVRPTRRLGSLTQQERLAIAKSAQAVLKEAIKYRGTSADAYLDARGQEGDFEKRLMVYGRGGKPCKKCGAPIVKITLGGRGTHYCPRDQK